MQDVTDLVGQDICCVCGDVAPYGTMNEVNEVDFELLCDKCINCRCSNCKSFKAYNMCSVHKVEIEDPVNKVCDWWEKD